MGDRMGGRKREKDKVGGSSAELNRTQNET